MHLCGACFLAISWHTLDGMGVHSATQNLADRLVPDGALETEDVRGGQIRAVGHMLWRFPLHLPGSGAGVLVLSAASVLEIAHRIPSPRHRVRLDNSPSSTPSL